MDKNFLLTFMLESVRVTTAIKRRGRVWTAAAMGMAITAIAIAAFCHALEGDARLFCGARPPGAAVFLFAETMK